MTMHIVEKPISREELKKIAAERFGDLVKAVVDIEQEKIAIGGELHADMETLLMETEGTKREHAWGINLYPDATGADFIEYDSLINLKPSFGNRTRDVEDPKIREVIEAIVKKTFI
jgi:hypothetical protein